MVGPSGFLVLALLQPSKTTLVCEHASMRCCPLGGGLRAGSPVVTFRGGGRRGDKFPWKPNSRSRNRHIPPPHRHGLVCLIKPPLPPPSPLPPPVTQPNDRAATPTLAPPANRRHGAPSGALVPSRAHLSLSWDIGNTIMNRPWSVPLPPRSQARPSSRLHRWPHRQNTPRTSTPVPPTPVFNTCVPRRCALACSSRIRNPPFRWCTGASIAPAPASPSTASQLLTTSKEGSARRIGMEQ